MAPGFPCVPPGIGSNSLLLMRRVKGHRWQGLPDPQRLSLFSLPEVFNDTVSRSEVPEPWGWEVTLLSLNLQSAQK